MFLSPLKYATLKVIQRPFKNMALQSVGLDYHAFKYLINGIFYNGFTQPRSSVVPESEAGDVTQSGFF